MRSPIGPMLRSWRAQKQNWDPDIAQALSLPLPRPAQERARALIQERDWEGAISEIRKATGYNRRDVRCIALALMYAWKIPHRPFPQPEGSHQMSHRQLRPRSLTELRTDKNTVF
ncbi:hypothetical protein [Kitasatospora sp. NPDC057198]|uniref:hypothetical protein n=1 Tax=Kitasatospora sp. NPDC057198 TaxID=3346046 RepID=UPI0036368DAA